MTSSTRRARTGPIPAAPTGDNTGGEGVLSKGEFELVADFRYSLRCLLRQTELEAAKLGITPQHYQLMLAVKGFPGREWANITELAERLQVRHNAVIGLVNRAEARGLLERRHDQTPGDRRVVQVHVTPAGEEVLGQLTAVLRAERERVSAAVVELARDAATLAQSHRSPALGR